MLAFFPTLFPDELLYSGIARYHLMSGNFAHKHSVNNIFEEKLVCSTVDLPTHVKYLSNKINNIYTVKQLIRDHTLYAYYSTFLPKEKAIQIFNLMSEGSPWGEVHISLGLASSAVKRPRYLRYCRECVTEDITSYKEPYWHRSHQIPGVIFCPIHKVELVETDILSPTREHKFRYVPLIQVELEKPKKELINPKWKRILIVIAELSYEILKIAENDYSGISKSYKACLNQRGYITARGRIRFKSLINDFCHFFSSDLLGYLNCDIDANSDDTWFHKMIRGKNSGSHPLKHILIQLFLGIKITKEEQLRKVDFPFGEGPWPCLNKAAGHYMKNTINKCLVTRDSKSGLPVGTFECSCGFIYSRKGPDKSTEDRYRIGRIKLFGVTWIEKLNEYNQLGLSLREKARLLEVDPTTVKKYSYSRTQQQEDKEDKENKLEKNKRRERFMASLKDAKANNIPVRQLNSKDYMWLYRHDKDWLEKNITQSKKNKKTYSIVDWEKRDDVVLCGVKMAFKLLQNEKRPKRITVSELSRNMEEDIAGYLHTCLNKLTKTNKYLKGIIETTEQFQIRRLVWAAKQLQREGFKVQGWKLLKEAGLNKPLNENVKLKYQDLITESDH
ncbi:TnsD family Tn7-like transposition protein [Fredinandcohnia salidurans]|uniref:TnsD family Tn7-like transposition protein n=1 Tax=Fredinandcohnia salidurans TaxID=2595041 RepID=A0ABW4MT42_9BACI